MRGHDAFEALAGAVALGEATSDERARYDAHRAGCAVCLADDADGSAEFVRSLRGLDAAEAWRPVLRDRVGAAIARTRRRRTRAIGTWFGVAIAASVALDLGVTSGGLARLTARLAPSGAAVAVALPEPVAAPRIPHPADLPALTSIAVAPHHHARRSAAERLPVRSAATTRPALVDPEPPVDDVVAGLALDPLGDAGAPRVAAVPSPAPSDGAVDAAPQAAAPAVTPAP